MSRISIYVKNKQYKPSNYYRIIQYVDYFTPANIKIHNLIPNFLYLFFMKYREHWMFRKLSILLTFLISGFHLFFSLIYDSLFVPEYIIIQKSIAKIKLPFFLQFLLKSVLKKSYFIWDFDDNILYNKEISLQEFDLYCKYAKKIIVPSNFLKNLLPKESQEKVLLLPTTDCTLHMNSQEEFNSILDYRELLLEKEIILVWLASSSSLEHLASVISILDETAYFIKKHWNKTLILKVICDKKITNPTNHLIIQNIKWSRDIVYNQLQHAHIGIMPLKDNPTTQGKAGFKVIQYLGMGLPIIASNVGYNKEHFTQEIGYLVNDNSNLDEWKNAIISILASVSGWKTYSQQSYEFYLKHFYYKNNIKKLRNLLNLD